MALARRQFTITDEAGNVIPGAHVEVRREIPGQPLASLFSDRDGTVGLSNPFDADDKGFAFFHVVGGAYQIRVYLGTSLAPTELKILRYVANGLNAEGDTAGGRQQRKVTAAGNITADPADDILIVTNTSGGAINVTVDWSLRTFPIRALTVVDGGGNANTYNIGIVPATGQTQYGTVNYRAVIDGNGGSVTLTPLTDGTGAF